jgi:YD repeat-containing protein
VSNPGYGYITSVTGGEPINGIINTCYLYNRTSSSKVPLGMTQGSHIGYGFVEITKGEEGVSPNNGKSTYLYTTAKDFPDIYSRVYPFPPTTSFDIRRGLLLDEKDYKYENGNYTLIKHSKNLYTNTDIRYSKDITGVVIASLGYTPMGEFFIVKSYKEFSKWVWLKEQTNELYSSGTHIENTVKYFYDNLDHLQATKIERTGTDGIKETTYLKYPGDFSDAESDQVTKDMKGSKFIFNAPIQKTISKSRGSQENVISSQVIKYANNLNAILPSENGFLETASPLNINDPISFPKYTPITGYDGNKFKRMGSYSYDIYGNLVSQQKTNDVTEVYVWGYNSQYPVAKITGSNYATVSGLITNQNILNNPTDDNTLRNYLNNLRSIPGAIVTTFTYKPLVGITSQTDPNNRTTYYTYDAFGRLELIKDQDNKILKKICYNYAGQPESCTTFFSAVKSGTYTRNNCGAGYVGGAATYTVAAGTYTSTVSQATADQLAQNDINANGQNYANTNGTCSPIYYSIAKSGTYTRNNCGAGYVGGATTYTVAAGAYTSTVSQATADQLAQNDVNANGQNYANTNGTCTSANIPITCQNYIGQSGFIAKYTNTATSQVTAFSILSTGGLQTLGSLPPGTYNLVISKTGNMTYYSFGSGCGLQVIFGKTATFNAISVSGADCNSIFLDYDY